MPNGHFRGPPMVRGARAKIDWDSKPNRSTYTFEKDRKIMALETLSGVEEIDGFKIVRHKPESMSWDDFDKTRDEFPINITERMNTISFKLQNGPIKENGVNGCQVDTLVAAAALIIEGLDDKFPCDENKQAVASLTDALYWLRSRKANREKRGVEGENKL